MEKKFRDLLMDWHSHENKRTMPWKGEKDAYKIWLSEIILQQTRVEQGLTYYEKFILHYPTITDLANAKDEVVFELWEGLGYYSRCKNLLFTARIVLTKFNGIFPTKYDDILSLKGVGEYTAAAIISFAYNQPYAVVDGNVYRVLARVFNIATPIDSIAGKKQFAQLANSILDKKKPAAYNQAIMDFGATICKPKAPLCYECCFAEICEANRKMLVTQLPVKEKKLIKKNRWLNYLILLHKNKVWVQKRTQKDIWQNLNEFYLIEENNEQELTEESIQKWLVNLEITDASIVQISSLQKQQLTHQTINGKFVTIKLENIPKRLRKENFIPLKDLPTLAFPKFIKQNKIVLE